MKLRAFCTISEICECYKKRSVNFASPSWQIWLTSRYCHPNHYWKRNNLQWIIAQNNDLSASFSHILTCALSNFNRCPTFPAHPVHFLKTNFENLQTNPILLELLEMKSKTLLCHWTHQEYYWQKCMLCTKNKKTPIELYPVFPPFSPIFYWYPQPRYNSSTAYYSSWIRRQFYLWRDNNR